jgi:hypothetical protein
MSTLRLEALEGDNLLPASKVETQNYVDLLSISYESLNSDIYDNVNKLNDKYVTLWVQALKRFRMFKDKVDSRWLGTFMTGDNETAIRYEELLEGFRKRFESLTGEAPTQVPSTHKLARSDFSLGSLTTPLIIGGVVIGGLWLWNSRK